MSNLTVKIIPSDGNRLSFSGNYRIFTMDEPVENPVNIYEVLEDVALGSAEESYVGRYVRYSQDGKRNWSLWYAFDPEDADGRPANLAFTPPNTERRREHKIIVIGLAPVRDIVAEAGMPGSRDLRGSLETPR